MKKQKTQRVRVLRTYSMIDEMMASPFQPLANEKRRHQLTRMWEGLRAIEQAPEPTNDDWRVCSDAVNLMETLCDNGSAKPDDHGVLRNGWWLDCAGEPVLISDTQGLLRDAVAALAFAGVRKMEGKQIRLDAKGIHAVRAVLEDYRDLLEVLPARTIIRAHRLTEKRISDIFSGRRRSHDVEVIDLREVA